MKRTACIVFAVLLLSFVACAQKSKIEETTKFSISQLKTDTAIQTTVPSTLSIVTATATTEFAGITFLPEEIKLDDSDYALGMYSSKEPMRGIYFSGFFALYHVLPDNFWYDEWEDSYLRKSMPIPEMAMVHIIKRYNIPKEVFEEARSPHLKYDTNLAKSDEI